MYRPLTLLLMIAAALSLGCGNSDPFGMVEVTGTVTFDGETCPAAGKIGFVPIETAVGLPRKPGWGTFDVDGKFVVQTSQKDSGLIPGRYAVRVHCLSGPITERMGDRDIRALSYVAPDYKAPELVVEQGGGPVTFDLDVPKRK